MSEPKAPQPALSEEFFIRVNDVIEAANRIERRYDTHHAELVMLHAFARYSAHHYRATAKVDDAANREAFAVYIANQVAQLIVAHAAHLAGEAPVVVAGPEPSAG